LSDDVVSNSAIHDDLATLQRETFDYFIREANPANGLIRDKTSFAGSMVVSAVDIGRRIMVLRGMGLPMYVSHATSKLGCNGLNGMDQPPSRQDTFHATGAAELDS
jgi:hypothetical protein